MISEQRSTIKNKINKKVNMNIDGKTDIIGIISDPIDHVRAPQVFNALFEQKSINAICIPFHVESQNLKSWLLGAAGLNNLKGLIVTMPHKEAVISACHELSGAAQAIGSVNAMRLDPETRTWTGGNFDGDGFVEGLRCCGHSLKGKRVLLLGMGGAGKSMAYSIARECPMELVIYNRSADRAIEFVNRLKGLIPELKVQAGTNDPANFDVVVNATSLGLRDADPLPIDPDRLTEGTLVCEAVMRDGDTSLLKAARKRNCMVHQGQHMINGQVTKIADFLRVSSKAVEN